MKRNNIRIILAAAALIVFDGIVIYLLGTGAILPIVGGMVGGVLVGWFWGRLWRNKKR